MPRLIKPFHLYTDASGIKLEAKLVQESKPLVFNTKKLNNSQLDSMLGEKDLFGIVKGPKVYEGVIWGQDLAVHTDHLNLLYSKLPSQCMMWWRSMLE